jgi:hypothetical protein
VLCSGPAYHIMHMNFGSPRVGNAAFVRCFDAAVPESWRLHSYSDVITYVPHATGLGYAHVGNSVDLMTSGQLRLGEHGGRQCALDTSGIGASHQVRSCARALSAIPVVHQSSCFVSERSTHCFTVATVCQ